MNAVIISIGDELILGQVADTNSAYLSSRLVEHGIVPEYHQTVPDDLAAIAGAVNNAASRANLIIITGGLGPTKDDLTRQAIASMLDVPLVLHKPSLAALRSFFKQRGRVMSESNRIQAMFPRGAQVLDNPIGTAPGFSVTFDRNFNVIWNFPEVGPDCQSGRLSEKRRDKARLRLWASPRRAIAPYRSESDKVALKFHAGRSAKAESEAHSSWPNSTIIVMPGVPREMKLMFERHVAPALKKKKAGKTVLTHRINVFGMGESLVGEKLGELMRRDRNPLVGTTASGGVISVRVRGEYKHAKKGALEMRRLVARIKRLLGDYVFSEGDVSLPEAVVKMLASKRKTLATAESCTAGMLGALITEAPGASRCYLGGWIVYANEMKVRNLSVPEAVIAREGAVSEAVATHMAEGALVSAWGGSASGGKSGADYALAITGIAGPGGGTPQKPVGTVWIALAEKNLMNLDGDGLTTGRKGGTRSLRPRPGFARGSAETSSGRASRLLISAQMAEMLQKDRKCIKVNAEKYCFGGERAFIRELAAKRALNILRLRLLEN